MTDEEKAQTEFEKAQTEFDKEWNDLMVSISRLFDSIAEMTVEMCRGTSMSLGPILDSYYLEWSKAVKQFPNRRVAHLALNAKKERTRKKNINRIIKEVLLDRKRAQ